jgi:iron(III) transport system permease protein
MRIPLLVLNLLIAFILVGYVLYPTAVSLQESFVTAEDAFTVQNYVTALTTKNYLSAIVSTLFISVATVILAGIFGLTLAYIFWRFTFPFKKTLSRFFLIPLGFPPLIGVLSFEFLYTESGILPRAFQQLFGLEAPPFFLNGMSAVLVVHTFSFFVHFYLFGYSSLSSVDYSLAEVAATLGAKSSRAFVKVIVPVMRPALVSASLIVFILSAASFTAPLRFANQDRFLTVEIYNQKIAGTLEMASTLTMILVLISVVMLLVYERYESQNKKSKQVQRGTARSAGKEKLTPGFRVVLILFGIFVLLPILVLVMMSFAQSSLSSRSILPDDFGFDNYQKIFASPSFYEPFLNSFSLALLASVPNLIFGVVAGILYRSLFPLPPLPLI